MKKTVLGVLSVVILLLTNFSYADSHDGTYIFDGKTWVVEIKKIDPSISEEMLQKMTESLQEYTIVIKGFEATAKFGPLVVKGMLEKSKEENDTTIYKMTPVDEDKKDEPAYLHITGNNMKFGPDNTPLQQIYFKKQN